MHSPPTWRLGPPFIYISSNERDLIVSAEYGNEGFEVRKMRGPRCRTIIELMHEFGAALQFFDGFGNNGNALRECLIYLDEWMPAKGYVLVFTDAEQVLADEIVDRDWLLDVLVGAGQWWSEAVTGQRRFDRPPVLFKAVFECSPGDRSWVEVCEEAGCGFDYL
ncbi:hypothetical protein EA187_17385 [Lujinxingia sediminis]|uniref:Barstar (barnase inhibitor) domain-containing protein n=1 Tax=Lujinxingia sediminis TaxID=2480984 RepID=A0ABY0CPY0_9DELT|nr:barstar family protein [Lujinxingia sediminis]RVU42112.1 hypothetical protein EA187_17385 [Lujinxingia sediminis]